MMTSKHKIIDDFFTEIIKFSAQDSKIIEISPISNLIHDNHGLFQYFCQKIKDLQAQLNYTQYFLVSNVLQVPLHLQNATDEYKDQVRIFILELLETKLENLISLSLLLFQYLSGYLREYINEFVKNITFLWGNNNPRIQCLAIKALEYVPVSNQNIFLDYVDRVIELIYNEDNCIKCYSMALYGNIFFYFTKTGEKVNLKVEEVQKLIEWSDMVEDIALRVKYYEGLEHLLSELGLFKREWIQFFIKTYNQCEAIALKNQLLRILVYFPNNKSFSETELDLYFNFFKGLFKELLDEKHEIEEPRVLYKSNIFMDILHQFEQLCFSLPETVDRLLPLYEKVIDKFFTNLRNQKGLSSGGLLRQWTHEIYGLLIKYHKEKLNSERINELTLKISNIQYSEITNIEFNINSLKHQVRIFIIKKDLSAVKEKLKELRGFFDKYYEHQSEFHQCYYIWVFIEDLIYFLTSTHENYEREKDRLIDNLNRNYEEIPDYFRKIFEKYEDFKPMLFGLNNCNSFSECLTLFGEIKIVLRNTLDEIVKIDSETLKEIFMQINQSNEYYFKDIASRLNIVLSRRSRKIKGFLEVKDKDFELMVKITEILKNIELSRFFGNVLPHEDVISKTLADILRQKKIPNVTLKKKLSGTSHIDITSGVTIAIEVKKIYSNKSKDELIGQLNEDLRIGNYHYGIGYGIDTTKSQLHARDNLVNVDFPRNRIVLVIKPNIT